MASIKYTPAEIIDTYIDEQGRKINVYGPQDRIIEKDSDKEPNVSAKGGISLSRGLSSAVGETLETEITTSVYNEYNLDMIERNYQD